jgi:hypothetical protein
MENEHPSLNTVYLAANMENEHPWLNTVYLAAIGLMTYALIDQLLDGQLSRNLSMWLIRTKGKLGYHLNSAEQFRKDFGKMLWQAEEILEGKQS